MSRIKKLETHYHEQLKEKDIKDISEFIQSIVDADITKGKYARFLIESFLNDKFLEEDLMGELESTIGQAISLFDKHKGKLPINERSVYALDEETDEALYQSPGDLWNKVKQFQNELSGKELKKEEQEQIYRETEFVYKDEETGFQIISPLTKESAQWWGKGTRWCTSAKNNNMFWNYAEKAPLLILLMPNQDKLQLWKNGDQIQFMNESDNDVSLNYIEKNWNILEPICLWLNDLKYIPIRYKTFEFCKLAVQQNSFSLQYVPNKYKTLEICELAVQQNGLALYHVPDELKTKEICEIAVESNGMALQYVPNKYKTQNLSELGVKQNGLALSLLSEQLRTRKVCEIAVKENGLALANVPNKYKTPEICKFAISQNGDAIISILTKYKTPELCKLAIIQNGMTLRFIPRELKTKELCELAVKENKLALQYVPKEYRTSALNKEEIKKNTETLKYIPKINKKHYHDCFSVIKQYFPNNSLSLNIN